MMSHMKFISGGLTTMLDDIQERFEFLVDAKTGTVLEVINIKRRVPIR